LFKFFNELKDTLKRKIQGQEKDRIELPFCPKKLIIALEDLIYKHQEILDEYVSSKHEQYLEAKTNGYDAELDQIEYDIWLAEITLNSAHKEAKRRLELIKSLDDESKIQDELTKCTKGGTESTLYFINNWAWTHDPRMPISTLPFVLYPKQVEYIEWLERLTFQQQRAGMTAKSRDMGVSWCVVAFITKHWRFKRRFDVLVGSKNEDFVDEKGREDTLMEKFRFIIKHLPEWMLPENFLPEKHMPFLKIINPETGSFVAGESANQNFGRQGRYSLLWIDEFQIFPEGGYSAYTSSSQSARARLYTGTPAGKLNKFADLYFKAKIRCFLFHWKDHPRKDIRWYNAQKLEMNDAEIAQELDINWDASQVGLVFPQWDELYSVITWSEFASFYGERARDYNGKPCIPLDWLCMMAQDVGMTEDHRNVTTWAARPKRGYALDDSVFLYRQYVAPVKSSIDETAMVIKEWEKPHREDQRMSTRKISHEALSESVSYEENGLDFEPWETDYCAGLAQGRNYMRVIDKHIPNPFRSWVKLGDDEPLKGRSRWYVIVPDKEGMPFFDKNTKQWVVSDPEPNSDAGFAKGRTEIKMYHIPASEQGKPVRLQRPAKMLDDAMDTWRAIALELPPIAGLTEEEELEAGLPVGLQLTNFKSHTDREKLAMLWLTRQMEIKERELAAPTKGHWRRNLYGGNTKRNF